MKEKEKQAHSSVSNGMERRGYLLEWYAATAQVHSPPTFTTFRSPPTINCCKNGRYISIIFTILSNLYTRNFIQKNFEQYRHVFFCTLFILALVDMDPTKKSCISYIPVLCSYFFRWKPKIYLSGIS